MPDEYRYPYIDSNIFISIVMREILPVKKDGIEVLVDRRAIGIHVIEKIESKLFKGVVCPYTYAECYKRRVGEKLADDKQDLVIEYLNNDECFDLIVVDRTVGIQANALCRAYGVMPTDAVHIACAIYAGCDKFLTWDGSLIKKKIPGIIIEEPKVSGQIRLGF